MWGAVLTLSTSSNILLVSGTSGALGTVTIIGVRVLPSVPIEAVLTTWGWVGGPKCDTQTYKSTTVSEQMTLHLTRLTDEWLPHNASSILFIGDPGLCPLTVWTAWISVDWLFFKYIFYFWFFKNKVTVTNWRDKIKSRKNSLSTRWQNKNEMNSQWQDNRQST